MSGRRGLSRDGGLPWGVLVAACGVATCWSPSAVAEKPPVQRRAIVDPGVVQAGGSCRGCRDPHCSACRANHHHAGCRDGKCHPHCPVRPQEFGFYGTQWRRWPGQGVVPTAGIQEATPTLPPKSAVPGPNEESRGPRAGELPAPEPGAFEPPPVTPPALQPAAPAEPPADAATPLVPDEPAAPAPEPPAGEPEAAAPPASEPPAEEPAGEDLFDESATGPVRRRFAVKRPAAAAVKKPQPAAVRLATLTYPESAKQQLPPEADGWQPRVPAAADAEATSPRR